MIMLSASNSSPSFLAAPDADLLARVADVLAWPLVLLLRDGSLLHANRAARQMLERGQPLRLGPAQRVQTAVAARQAEFDAALTSCTPAHPQLMHWPGRGGGANATLTALPLDGEDMGVAPDDPLLLALTLPAQPDSQVAGFARLYGLSDAETRVLQRLAEGDDSRRAARALGVSASTVRSQAASLRRKTGHASVAELLRLLATLPPVLEPIHEGE